MIWCNISRKALKTGQTVQKNPSEVSHIEAGKFCLTGQCFEKTSVNELHKLQRHFEYH